MTTMEKAANSLITIIIARFAMIVTPALLWFIWNGQIQRIERIEVVIAKHTLELQDHESRIGLNKDERNNLKINMEKQASTVNATLQALNAQLVTLNGSLIDLKATIRERLPERTTGRSVK